MFPYTRDTCDTAQLHWYVYNCATIVKTCWDYICIWAADLPKLMCGWILRQWWFDDDLYYISTYYINHSHILDAYLCMLLHTWLWVKILYSWLFTSLKWPITSPDAFNYPCIGLLISPFDPHKNHMQPLQPTSIRRAKRQSGTKLMAAFKASECHLFLHCPTV